MRDLEEKKKRKRKFWVHPIWQVRKEEGEYHTAFPVMKTDEDMFFRYYRMSPKQFDELHSIVRRDLRRNFVCREPLCSEERLAITLRYLSSGMAIKQIALAFRVAPATCRLVIHNACRVIWKHLEPLYLPEPGPVQWEESAQEFSRRWNFPHCVGAVDGKHVQIIAPPNSGSSYFNYKGTFSIVLMAIVDAKYKFMMVDVGAPGRHSDGGVFKSCTFGKKLNDGVVALPAAARLPKSQKVAPHVFVGDEAFQLRTDFLRPFPGKGMLPIQRVFNYRLSRARRIVENAFGILTARWRILLGPMNLLPKNATFAVLACCALHNFISSARETTYCPPGYVDSEDDYGNIVPGQWRSDAVSSSLLDLETTQSRNYRASAADTRNLFAQYFFNEGAIAWQWAHTGLTVPQNP
ncbi:uncharacterized protein [Dermacentor albipictus]|uniref:uncharacterized protein n=1 Tax=Dermacentor albipictus TaxID=60249 RepID=UPI0038FC9EF2